MTCSSGMLKSKDWKVKYTKLNIWEQVNKRIAKHWLLPMSTHCQVVRSVYKGYSREPENVPFMNSCPFTYNLK